jgi:hypothetical protein
MRNSASSEYYVSSKFFQVFRGCDFFSVMEDASYEISLVAKSNEFAYHSLCYQFLSFAFAGLVHNNADSFLNHGIGSLSSRARLVILLL